MDSLERLQHWYKSQCDGDWEHAYGVKIDTLDNPGWIIEIDLKNTKAADCSLEKQQIDRSEQDWIHYSTEDGKFTAACGPLHLSEGIALFLDWYEGQRGS
jgi:hypothetical protein